jgi:hypothetical protein
MSSHILYETKQIFGDICNLMAEYTHLAADSGATVARKRRCRRGRLEIGLPPECDWNAQRPGYFAYDTRKKHLLTTL